ncbi:MAG TPA: FHA domain-containing protein [Kofleriaceae bacterium]|nr:FHA domain-containing protein [Kofleriaceae bacterium]
MDVGLVCDECHTFNPMGARACARCGEALSLDQRPPAVPLVIAVESSASARVSGNPGRTDESSRPTTRGESSDGSERGLDIEVDSVPLRTCGMCGDDVEPDFKFCGTCGAAMQEETRPAVRVPLSSPAGADGNSDLAEAIGGTQKRTLFFGAMQAARAKLVLIKGDGLDGVSFTLAGEDHVAGRADDSPLPFAEDPFMSPVHANFFYRKNQLIVRDEDSVNGIFIRIRGSVPIELGDRFLVGEQVIEVQSSLPSDEPLRALADGTYYYASPRPPSHFRLIQLLRGGDSGLAFQAQSDVVSLGREGNDLNFPDDPFISGHHAQVSFADGGLSLTDLGSKNGTFLRVSRESALQHGDYVFMGQQLLRVEIV